MYVPSCLISGGVYGYSEFFIHVFFHQLQIRYLQINFSSCRGCQMFSFRVCFFCICNKPLHPQTLPCVVHTWKLRFQEVALRQVGMQAGARLQTLLHRLEINWKIVWQQLTLAWLQPTGMLHFTFEQYLQALMVKTTFLNLTANIIVRLLHTCTVWHYLQLQNQWPALWWQEVKGCQPTY